MKIPHKHSVYFLLIMVLHFAAPCLGQIVSSNEDLYQAVRKIQPGGIIRIADGVYQDVQLVVMVSGKANAPIVIKAEHPGQVFFTGDAKVELRGQYLVLEGIWFKNGNRNVETWKAHGPGLVAIYGSHNRVTCCVFDCFDEANSAYITTSLTKEGKVPQYCRIDHCSFTDKITFDQVINLNNTTHAIKDGSVGGPPMYHRVDHCFFSNPQKPGNAGGGIRVGYNRNDMGRCLIDSNLFMRQDSEAEIITSKSQENVYYANTFINCQGTMNFRHGDHQVAINNFYIGNDRQFGYGGMFVWGSRHIIACNYFELSETIKSRGNAALYLNPGARASEHALAFDMLITNNSFHNVNGYAIHFNPLDERRKEYCTENHLKFETPCQLLLKGNIFFTNKQFGYPFFKDEYFKAGKNTWKDNVATGAKAGTEITIADTGYKTVRVEPVEAIEGIQLDLTGLINKGITGKPLTWDDVRPPWLKEIPGTYALGGRLSVERAGKFKAVIKRSKTH
uniref:chondroitinase-B n=1 Tax=Pedobacter schmidteae TaxID=2201271 RepID=UPI000EADD55A|nr:chondroitinase-B [Pedobacter schmidteae]